MRTRSWLAVGVAGVLAGCFNSKTEGGGGADGDSSAAAAEALTKSVSFTGGKPVTGLLPAESTTSVTLTPASGNATPGSTSLMAFDFVGDPNNPITLTLLQFKGAKGHFEIDAEIVSGDGGVDSGTVKLEYEVDDAVCENLCARVFDIEVVQAVKLKDGKISKHVTGSFALDCTKKGDRARCRGEKPADGEPDAGSDQADACADAMGCGAEYMCDDGTPLYASAKCDGVEDCPDKSDEAPAHCSSTMDVFQCMSGEPVTLDQLCDGTVDCADMGDESRADDTSLPEPGICIPCADESGLYFGDRLCDGTPDCADGSDEASCGML